MWYLNIFAMVTNIMRWIGCFLCSWTVMNLKEVMIRKLVTRKFEEEVREEISQNEQKMLKDLSPT